MGGGSVGVDAGGGVVGEDPAFSRSDGDITVGEQGAPQGVGRIGWRGCVPFPRARVCEHSCWLCHCWNDVFLPTATGGVTAHRRSPRWVSAISLRTVFSGGPYAHRSALTAT